MPADSPGILKNGKRTMINVDKTYICHWTKLVERKKYILQHLAESGIIDLKWVEDYDKNNWCVEDIIKEYPRAFGIISNVLS